MERSAWEDAGWERGDKGQRGAGRGLCAGGGSVRSSLALCLDDKDEGVEQRRRPLGGRRAPEEGEPQQLQSTTARSEVTRGAGRL